MEKRKIKSLEIKYFHKKLNNEQELLKINNSIKLHKVNIFLSFLEIIKSNKKKVRLNSFNSIINSFIIFYDNDDNEGLIHARELYRRQNDGAFAG